MQTLYLCMFIIAVMYCMSNSFTSSTVLHWCASTSRAPLYAYPLPKVGHSSYSRYYDRVATTNATPRPTTAWVAKSHIQSTHFKHYDGIATTKVTPRPTTLLAAKSRRKIIFFLHLHKSGGTSVCGAAHDSNERASPNGCNVQKDRRCCGGETEGEQTSFALQTKYSFVASEGYMYREMNTEHYMYIIALRVSVSRYFSHYQHVVRGLQITTTFYEWTLGQPDNWNTRHICGTRCVLIPKYGLSVSDFTFAAHRLANFSHIVFMHDFDTSFAKMARALSWRVETPRRLQAARPYNSTPDSSGTKAMTFLDDLLYEYARESALRNFSVDTVRQAIASTIPPDAHKYSLACGLVCSEY